MDSYEEFINIIVNSIQLIDFYNNIVSIYLGGSMARGDYSIGTSDIDIYVVVNDIGDTDKYLGYIQDIAINKLGDLLSWCPDGVTVAFTDYDEIKNGMSWLGAGCEYYSFQETGKLIYGKDIKQEIKKPTASEMLLSSQRAIEQLKQIINQDVSNITKDKYFIRSIFGSAFSAMFFYLCCNNIYIRGKERIVSQLQKLNVSFSKQAEELLLLWNKFGKCELSESDINDLISFTRIIILSI